MAFSSPFVRSLGFCSGRRRSLISIRDSWRHCSHDMTNSLISCNMGPCFHVWVTVCLSVHSYCLGNSMALFKLSMQAPEYIFNNLLRYENLVVFGYLLFCSFSGIAVHVWEWYDLPLLCNVYIDNPFKVALHHVFGLVFWVVFSSILGWNLAPSLCVHSLAIPWWNMT